MKDKARHLAAKPGMRTVASMLAMRGAAARSDSAAAQEGAEDRDEDEVDDADEEVGDQEIDFEKELSVHSEAAEDRLELRGEGASDMETVFTSGKYTQAGKEKGREKEEEERGVGERTIYSDEEDEIVRKEHKLRKQVCKLPY